MQQTIWSRSALRVTIGWEGEGGSGRGPISSSTLPRKRPGEVMPRKNRGPDMGREIRQQATQLNLHDTDFRKFTRLGDLAMNHLTRRLQNPKTPAEVKDRIALAVMPRMAMVLRTRTPPLPAGEGSKAVRDLMAQYRIG